MSSFQFLLIAVCLVSISTTDAGTLRRMFGRNGFQPNVSDLERLTLRMFGDTQYPDTNIGFPIASQNEESPEPFAEYNSYVSDGVLSSDVSKVTRRSKRNGSHKVSESDRRLEESLRRALDKIYRDIDMLGLRVGRK